LRTCTQPSLFASALEEGRFFLEGGERMLTKAKKEQIVHELTDNLQKSPILVVVDYRGLSVTLISELRKAIRQDGGVLQVCKNTLAKRAIQNIDIQDAALIDHLDGTNAFFFVKEGGDPIAALKQLVKFGKEKKIPEIKFGYFEGKVYNAEGMIEISKLPSRDQLLAMVLNTMQAPITGLVVAMSGIIRNLAYAIKAIQEKKES